MVLLCMTLGGFCCRRCRGGGGHAERGSGGFKGDGGRWRSVDRLLSALSGAGRGGMQPTSRNVASR